MWTGAETADRGDRHAQALAMELAWLEQVVQARLAQHFGAGPGADLESAAGAAAPPPASLRPPRLPEGSALADVHAALNLDADARVVLSLALAPHLRPALLDLLFVRNRNLDRVSASLGAGRADRTGASCPRRRPLPS